MNPLMAQTGISANEIARGPSGQLVPPERRRLCGHSRTMCFIQLRNQTGLNSFTEARSNFDMLRRDPHEEKDRRETQLGEHKYKLVLTFSRNPTGMQTQPYERTREVLLQLVPEGQTFTGKWRYRDLGRCSHAGRCARNECWEDCRVYVLRTNGEAELYFWQFDGALRNCVEDLSEWDKQTAIVVDRVEVEKLRKYWTRIVKVLQ
jgi:hypothetical protein